MITSSPLLRVRQACAALLDQRADRYTAGEVSHLLHPDARGSDRRRQAVLEAAAVPSAWLAHLDRREACELGRLAERLPTIVFLHASGSSPEQIAQRVGGWGAWGVERALDVAARCIAERLNRRPGPSLGDAA
jgi:hypothetical protein